MKSKGAEEYLKENVQDAAELAEKAKEEAYIARPTIQAEFFNKAMRAFADTVCKDHACFNCPLAVCLLEQFKKRLEELWQAREQKSI